MTPLPSPALIIGLIVCGPLAFAAWADDPKSPADTYQEKIHGDPELHAMAAKLAADHDLPGMVVAVATSKGTIAKGSAGLRKRRSPESFTVDDLIHLGSCTKAMTASLVGQLVEEKVVAWDSTVAECLPALADDIHDDYKRATLAQLLSHRAGLEGNAPDWWNLGEGSQTEQRVELVKQMLTSPPSRKPGDFHYSNAGYAVAGLMLETKTGTSWEDLMRAKIFDPLEMKTAGFGPPGTSWKVDQPWGHQGTLLGVVPWQFDNAPPLGPAGRVHASIDDWGKFVAAHLRGLRGHDTPIGPSSSILKQHVPSADEHGYAFGWGVIDREWAQDAKAPRDATIAVREGKAHSHSGSNTMWFCVVWMAPAKDFAVMAATNIAGDKAAEATDTAASQLIQWQSKRGR